MHVLQVIDANDQLIEATLDGSLFYVGLTWNSEDEAWSVGLQNANGGNLVRAIKVIPNYPLFFQFRRSFMPLGELSVAMPDTSVRLDRNSFRDNRASLVYFTEADLEEYGVIEKFGRL